MGLCAPKMCGMHGPTQDLSTFRDTGGKPSQQHGTKTDQSTECYVEVCTAYKEGDRVGKVSCRDRYQWWEFPPPQFGTIVSSKGNKFQVQFDSTGNTVFLSSAEIVPMISKEDLIAQRKALQDIWNSTNGRQWTSGKWKENAWDLHPENSLEGIDTDSAGRVTKIKLESRNRILDGYLPVSIGNLQNIVALNLAGNNLRGEIPCSLGNMSELVQLNLENNKLSGCIPECLSKIDSLVWVYLQNNDFVGAVPKALLVRGRVVNVDGCKKLTMAFISFEAPMMQFHVVPRKVLLNLKRLIPHEEAGVRCLPGQQDECRSWRDNGLVEVLKPNCGSAFSYYQNTIEDEIFSRDDIAFISHRWLSDDHPDDDENSKMQHLHQLAVDNPEFLYFWIDYMCVPQDNKAEQAKAILSLPHYIKRCGTLITLCGNSGRSKLDVYKRRGWCRLEQLSTFLPMGGKTEVYIANKHSLKFEKFKLSIHEVNPTKGIFKEDSDRELVSDCVSRLADVFAQYDGLESLGRTLKST